MYTKLDPEFKEKWVAALRSGEYKQGMYKLYDESTNTYCCLGVAAVVAGIPKDIVKETYAYPTERKTRQYSAAYADMSHAAAGELIEMNDEMGKNFNQIAKWIEKNL